MANYELGYSGKAIIKVIKGNKVIKTVKKSNAGTESLFKAIYNSLIGNPTTGMPNYIGAFTECSTKSTGNVPALKTKIVITSKTSDGKSAKFETTFPSNALIKDSNGTIVRCLRMYTSGDSDDDDYLAEIDLGKKDQIEVGNNESLVIQWLMTIANVNNVKEEQDG